ncbi:MAG: DUF4139 domain-containing protein, partial [Limisphaerales bacterium]
MKNLTSMFLIASALAPAIAAAEPALTIYNQDFAVVRDTVPLDFKAGINTVQFSGMTAHAEPDSVVLRDSKEKHNFQILEQNYRNDPVSQELLLSLCEGKTIDFERTKYVNGQPQSEIIQGKIIRSGYAPHYSAMSRYGYEYQQAQINYAAASQPLVEVDGKLRFGLPGVPLFPELPDDTILKPTLVWLIQSVAPAKFDAELSYISEGMSWEASYNLVAPEKGDRIDLVGWVTIDNQSGKSFENAKIKLMAGDVNKIQPQNQIYAMRAVAGLSGAEAAPPVSQKAFDEYHLYTLERPTTLLDRETKQVEFVHASGIESKTIYVYDGAQLPNVYPGWSYENTRYDQGYGTRSNPKVWVMREFANSETNHLGIPLPAGRLRFYRRDNDGQLEFTGENTIDHTPKDETIRVLTGNAFDLVGERKQTSYNIDNSRRILDESFEIKLRNHKKEPVEIRVVEHLYRGDNWEITAYSDTFLKTDAHTMEFRVQVKPSPFCVLDELDA